MLFSSTYYNFMLRNKFYFVPFRAVIALPNECTSVTESTSTGGEYQNISSEKWYFACLLSQIMICHKKSVYSILIMYILFSWFLPLKKLQ